MILDGRNVTRIIATSGTCKTFGEPRYQQQHDFPEIRLEDSCGVATRRVRIRAPQLTWQGSQCLLEPHGIRKVEIAKARIVAQLLQRSTFCLILSREHVALGFETTRVPSPKLNRR